MSWRNSVRKQINRAKSRRNENEITKKISDSNKKFYEENQEEIRNMGRSLYYSNGDNDYSY